MASRKPTNSFDSLQLFSARAYPVLMLYDLANLGFSCLLSLFPSGRLFFASRFSIALLCFECDNTVAFVLPFDFDTMCEIKSTIKFSFSKESDKPTIGEAVNFVKSLDADHGQFTEWPRRVLFS